MNFQNNNPREDKSDLEWVKEFHSFLMGGIPNGITLSKEHKPNMSAKKAFAIIWYLQEHLAIFPSTIEMCDNCHNLFNSEESGEYDEKKGKHFCDNCY